MKRWHYSRIKIPARSSDLAHKIVPFQATAGNWVFFYIRFLHDATKTPFRCSYFTMHTLGLDGVE